MYRFVHLVPAGKYEGTPLSETGTPWLLWWTSQDHLRSKFGDFSRAALIELRERLADPHTVEEMFALPLPAEIWAARRRDKAERKAAKAKARALQKATLTPQDANDISDLL